MLASIPVLRILVSDMLHDAADLHIVGVGCAKVVILDEDRLISTFSRKNLQLFPEKFFYFLPN